jgi:hypothetical protein
MDRMFWATRIKQNKIILRIIQKVNQADLKSLIQKNLKKLLKIENLSLNN